MKMLRGDLRMYNSMIVDRCIKAFESAQTSPQSDVARNYGNLVIRKIKKDRDFFNLKRAKNLLQIYS